MRTAAYYREKAARFRAMAKESDDATAASFEVLAKEYEALARRQPPEDEPPVPTGG
jgi:hypothetical protein